MEGKIDVTGINLVEAVKAAYDLSVPQGLGFLHAQPGSLTDAQAASLVREDDNWAPVSLDYVLGRSCKFTVFRSDGKLWINSDWYDHTPAQLADLLRRIGVESPAC